MKIAFAILLLLVAAAAVAMGFMSAPASAQPTRLVPMVVMRPVPGSDALLAMKDVVPAVIPAPAAAPKEDDELEVLKPSPRPAEPKAVEAKPAPVAAAEPKPAEARPAEVKPPPVAQPKPAPVAVVEEKPAAEPKPAPVAAKPPAPRPDPVVKPATGGGEVPMGIFNLRASDTADVFVDGKKVGGSPVLVHKVKPGKHKIRFDCYDATGEARPGVSQTYEVAADGEKDVEYDCPTE